ncbi:hypothetical protein BCR34DRAFT_600862 [Clohesyomyces aquaticus]|uniref:Uncharacterized protein n=1 Tax=Clohesyomyces aquaticus TaxID=1231657 RepID=A0A1Y1ZPE3_9PLEO|nr:hypothetical protein BCR34DRAFT_600862 [Clohesyomyces aquaticus]
MPEHRDWFIDRRILAHRGNMTVGAVRMKQEITCRGWKAEPTSKKDTFYVFKTKMASHRPKKEFGKKKRHSEEVQIRGKPRLAVWVHDYDFLSPTRTHATIIFAILQNGTIEEGLTTNTLSVDKKGNGTNLSSIACDVDIEFVDDILKIGSGTPGMSFNITSIKSLRDPTKGRDKDSDNDTQDKGLSNATLNELALWFAVAPVANGVSVDGTQPMYAYDESSNGIPKRYTSTNSENEPEWTIEYIKHFIRVSIGASALGDSTTWPDGPPVTMTSMANTLKMDSSRYLLLIIPPLIIMSAGQILLVWNILLHQRLGIPSMRLSTLDEILKSAQTEDILRPGAFDKTESSRPSRLNELHVVFARTAAGYWGLQNPEGRHHKVRHKPLGEYEMLVR